MREKKQTPLLDISSVVSLPVSPKAAQLTINVSALHE